MRSGGDKMKGDKVSTIICACFILILEVIALLKGVDGVALSVAVGGLAGLGGYTVKKFIR